MAKHRRKSTWMSQAQLQALVRFGPEYSGLKAAAREAKSAYGTTVRQADATSRGIQYAVDQARPDVAGNYDQAGLQAARAAHVADASLGPGVPDSIKAAIGAERAGFTSRLGESRAQALTELSDRKVQAVEGAGFAKSNAESVLASTLTKLFERRQDLGREKGAFTVATAQQLKAAADKAAATLANQEAGRGQSERNSIRSSGIDPDTGKPIPGGSLDPKAKSKGPKKKTQDEINRIGAASDEIDRLRGEIKTFPGAKRGEIRELLLAGDKGSEGTPLHDPATGKPLYNKDGTPKTGKPRPALEKAKSRLLLDIALDLETKHYVSRENHQKLVRRGLRLRDLGLPSEQGYKRRAARNAPRYKPPNNKNSSPKYGAH